MTATREMPLSGGRTTQGVVRVGDTVRRPRQPNAVLVERLLRHLGARGFDGAPRFLGVDDRGRDSFSFIDGAAPADLGWHDDPTLRRAAALIRRYHDLSAELAADGEVICHNDLSPCNFVFRDGAPVAIIDFDAAALGTRLHDLGYAAWLWLDVGNPDIDAALQRRRLALFLAAYGPVEADATVAAMLDRQTALAADGERRADPALAAWAADCAAWTQQHLV